MTFHGHTNVIQSVCLSDDARWGLSASWDKTVKLWDMESGECARTLAGHEDYVSSVDLSSDGRFAVSGSSDKTIRVWNLITGECVRLLEFDDEISTVAFASGAETILVATYSKVFKHLNVRTGDACVFYTDIRTQLKVSRSPMMGDWRCLRQRMALYGCGRLRPVVVCAPLKGTRGAVFILVMMDIGLYRLRTGRR